MKTIFYAGIGSRETPTEVLQIMQELASLLERKGFHLCSGGAIGADSAFESGVNNTNNKSIYLAKDTMSNKDFIIAEHYHPAWNKLSPYVKSLMARNIRIVQDVSFIICYTKNGTVSGGTGQAMRYAIDRNIPIFNLGKDIDDVIEKLIIFAEEKENKYV